MSGHPFQSTPSAREGDLLLVPSGDSVARFNPRLPRGKATPPVEPCVPCPVVSIHAFREGRRRFPVLVYCSPFVFQSTPSAREGDRPIQSHCRCHMKFQSTPSAREGDAAAAASSATRTSFNPRLPRGKATRMWRYYYSVARVSIHAFREGRRLPLPRQQSTDVEVSIHAFREGRRLH